MQDASQSLQLTKPVSLYFCKSAFMTDYFTLIEQTTDMNPCVARRRLFQSIIILQGLAGGSEQQDDTRNKHQGNKPLPGRRSGCFDHGNRIAFYAINRVENGPVNISSCIAKS
jgi:hypothetical protein